MKKNQMLQGFTLVEIMIVVAIIAILSAIAIPNFIQNRKDSQKNACISNLKQMVGACEQIKMKGLTATNSGGGEDDVATYIKGYATLTCPSNKTSGPYAVPADGADPTCPATVEGHTLGTAAANNEG